MIFPAWLWIGMLAAANPCGPGDALCSCAGRVSPREQFERSDAVFRDVVVKVSRRREEYGPNQWYLRKRVVVRVVERWKGAEAATVVVRTGMGGGDCGYPFERGREYLIYTRAAQNSELATGICTRTNRIEHAGEDLRELRALAPAAAAAVDLVTKKEAGR
ncbi:MAG TPA: hypothetical protein VF746_17800 [Longimicrobium sp.]|jgi:hypothetical protein